MPPKPKPKTKAVAASKPKRTTTKTDAASKRGTAKVATTKAVKSATAKAAQPAAVAKPKPLPKKYQRIREQLLEEAARLRADLREVEMRTSRMTESEVASETGGYDDHPADMASETYEREKDLALGENLQDILGKIRIALEKMDRGSYGTCDACGQKIAPERLEALPFATLCVSCQSRLEGR